MSTPAQLSVSNGSAVITGANVFLNGTSVGVTASDGTFILLLSTAQNNIVQVTASGYQSNQVTVAPLTTNVPVILTATPVVSQPITLSLGTPGATYAAAGPNGFSDSGTLDPSGTILTGASYAPGAYQVTWTYQSATRTDSFTVVAGQTVYNFAPLPVTDPGTSGGAPDTSTAAGSPAAPTSSNPTGPAATAAAAGTSVQAPIPSTANQAPVFSWPAYNAGKYLTPTQAFLYIGNLFIDELNGFQYTLQDNALPVFGYSSSKMDAVGRGKSLVQGQLSINFVSEGYLYTVLTQYAQMNANPQAADEQAALNLSQQLTALYASPSVASSSVQSQIATVQQQLLSLFANNANLPSIVASSQTAVVNSSSNAVYKKIPFDIVCNFEGGGRTITKRIQKCILISNEQTLADNDSTILDSYGFIARSIQ